jgi:hypothetical protein
MNEEIIQLKRRVEELESFIQNLQFSSRIPLSVDQSFRERFLKDVVSSATALSVANGGTGATTLSGILKGNGTSAITAISQLSGSNTFWAAATSGGATTKGVNITDGVVVSFS